MKSAIRSRLRARALLILTGTLGLLPGNLVFSAPPLPSPTPKGPKSVHMPVALKKRFIAACSGAFQASGREERPEDESSRALSRKICECAADETKSQGATNAAVEQETAEILKNKKHVIQDQHVLDALHYCAIITLHGSDEEHGPEDH